jgi:uncharacterized membrane protein YjjB (DUF3815 family)
VQSYGYYAVFAFIALESVGIPLPGETALISAALYAGTTHHLNITVLAVLANAAGRALLGAAAGVFVAALAIGTIGGLVSGMLRRSPLVFIVPGVLILVPGSAGFNSLLKLLTGQTVSGIDAGFNTFVTAMAIAYGLMLSSVILPRRFTSIGTRGAAHA